MKDGGLRQFPKAIRDQFAAHRHSALLAAIIALFAVRPLIGEEGKARGYILFSSALLIVLLIALYNINVDELMGEREILLSQTRRWRLIGWTLVALAFAERLALVAVHSRSVDLAGLSVGCCFFRLLPGAHYAAF